MSSCSRTEEPGTIPTNGRSSAERLFGARLPAAERYAEALATRGIERGLLGPREADRLWQRHLLNSAVLSEVVPARAAVVDIGSGAGLPGIPLALARPDLRMVLLEPMLRRTRFLDEVIGELDLSDQVQVLRGRAPEDSGRLPFPADCAVARAVAPLERLVSWTMPVIRPGGVLLALRGQSAEDEVRASVPAVIRAGGEKPELLHPGVDLLPEPVTVVRVVRRLGSSRRRSASDEPGRDRDRPRVRGRRGPAAGFT